MAKKNPTEPLRYQIRREIIEFLSENKYAPGDKLPTEQELMDMLDVGRSSLREGLHLLEEERIVRTLHGSGRYLMSPPNELNIDITRLVSFTEMFASFGIDVVTKVIKVREIVPSVEIATQLNLKKRETVVEIERSRYSEDTLVIHSVDMIPKKILPGKIDDEIFSGSLLEVLEEWFGVRVDYSLANVQVVTSDNSEVEKLELNPDATWVLLEQINFDRAGEPVIYSKDYHRGDYIRFQVRRYRD